MVADRETLKRHYGHKLQLSALPPTENLEVRGRAEVHEKLAHATRACANSYQKGKRSFVLVGELDPKALEEFLPSFVRAQRILNDEL